MLVHILMIAPGPQPLPGSGSVEICMLAIAKRLAKRHRVTIVCRQLSSRGAPFTARNLRIVRLSPRSQRGYLASVLLYIRGKRFDVIQVDNRPRYVSALKQAVPRTPVSLFLHSLTFVSRRPAVKKGLNRADLIVCNSHSLKSSLQQRYPGISSKLRTVHLGVDISRFKPLSEPERRRRRARYRMKGTFTVLYVGRIIPRKGLPVLIRAASKLKRRVGRARLVIAGGGNSAFVRRLKSMARGLGAPAVFVGKKPHADIHKLYQAADCFVCPSQRHESFGLVNVEAMACGVPVIASRIGGIKEIVRHGGSGYLVGHYRSPAAWARYMAKIADRPLRGKAMGRKGRAAAVQRFGWKRTAGTVATIYERLV
jgi:spore coat protein SA